MADASLSFRLHGALYVPRWKNSLPGSKTFKYAGSKVGGLESKNSVSGLLST